jgi:hypothetical protein
MPVPASINDLSTTPGSNYPAGTETPTEGDNYLRTLSAFIAQLRDMLNGTSGAPTVLTLTVTNATTLNGNVTIGNAAGDALTINPNAIALVNTPTITGATTWASAQTFNANPAGRIVSGTYTPTGTAAGNISAITPAVANYLRIGDMVLVEAEVSVTDTSGANTQSTFRLTLPIASDLSAAEHLGGSGTASGSINLPARVEAETTSNLATVIYFTNTPATRTVRVVFMYRVL